MKEQLPLHKDTYFFGYGIDINNPVQMANDIIDLKQENQQLKDEVEEYKNPIKYFRYANKNVIDENQELKKQLEKKYSKIGTLTNEVLYEENTKLINQQQEFIKYMENIIKELECDDVDDEEMRGYLFQRIDTFKEILQKYKEIIGGNKDEKR